MPNPTFTFQPYTGYTVPVISVYSDQTALLTSPNNDRMNYSITADVNINDNTVGVLKCYPIDNIMEVNPQKIAENYLLHDFNPDAIMMVDNPDSIKRINTVIGEQFSRTIIFSAITNYFGYAQFELQGSHLLAAGDRVLVKKDDTSINPQYNTFAKVIAVSAGTSIITDLPYVSSSVPETGILYEGSEFFDFSWSTQGIWVTTTNNHHFNVGDTVFIQMDTCATGKLKLVSGTHGQILSLNIGSNNILPYPVNFTTDIAGTIQALKFAIENNYSTYRISAYQFNGSSSILHLWTANDEGTALNGQPITISTTGDLTFAHSPALFMDERTDSSTNQGWNPQFSGTYKITKKTSNQFLCGFPMGLGNEPGSQRGSIYSLNNYVFTGLTNGETYWIMNNSNRYYLDNYKAEIAKHYLLAESQTFLTNKPRNSFEYSSLNEVYTLDFLYNPARTGEPNKIGIVEFDSHGNQRGIYGIATTGLTSAFTSMDEWKKISVGCGAWNLNNINPADVYPVPSGGIIKSDTSKYIVSVYTGLTQGYNILDLLARQMESITFTKTCAKHKYYQLIFLNKYGSFDCYNINGNYIDKLNLERIGFERKLESASDMYHYGFTAKDRGITDIDIKSNKTIKLTTDWLSMDEANWLSEVFESPQVYLYSPEDGNANTIEPSALFPVTIIDTEVIIPNERSRMKQFEINVQLASRRINQKN